MKIGNGIALSAIMLATQAFADGHEFPTATAMMVNVEGETIGEATLTQAPEGVIIYMRVEGLTPGRHGLHMHSVGVCDGAEGFTTAKGHVANSHQGLHGLLNASSHAGELPNLFVGADGIGEAEFYTTRVTITDLPGENLLDEDGSTFIIHEAGDDHISQPIGGSGSRVACGIITQG